MEKENATNIENPTPVATGNNESGERERRTGFFQSVFRDSRNIASDKLENPGINIDGSKSSESGPGTDSGNAKRTTGRRAGNTGKPTHGTGPGTGTGSNAAGTPTGSQDKTATVGTEGVTVEEQPKPRRGRPRGSRNRSTKGAIKADHIAGMTVQLFHLAAIVKQAPWWNVEDSKELEFWTPQAAELANKYIDETAAQKALEFNAAVTVCLGVGIMVMKRVTMDTHMRRQRIAETKAKEAPKEKPHPQAPKPTNVRSMTRKNDYGGGAAPTRPDEPIEGLGMTQNGLV